MTIFAESSYPLHKISVVFLGVAVLLSLGAYGMQGGLLFAVPKSTADQRNRTLNITQALIANTWRRSDLGAFLNEWGFGTGVELGVQTGIFTGEILTQWTACSSFYLVDFWRSLSNYKDTANVNNQQHMARMFAARNNVARFEARTKIYFFPMLTSDAAEFIPSPVDFVYVDARHDYCGVSEDIRIWWPKVRPGGVMAGHDYLDNSEMKSRTPWQDWSVCGNGTVHTGAVKQAVRDFAERERLKIWVSDDPWPSWLVQKPLTKDVHSQSRKHVTTKSF
jgi:hypothetical protein